MQKMVIFDFDGVICDSWWLTHKTSKKVYPGLTEHEHKDGFEGNIYEWETALKYEERKDIDWWSEYEKEMHLVKFFKRMEEVISDLARDYVLAIVSSTTTKVVSSYLERESLRGHFADIFGADIHESKHHKIRMLCEKYELETSDCIMVTDTTGDVREAAMVGVESIGVSWGFHELYRLENVKTFSIVHKPEELSAAIADYFFG